MDLPFSLTRTLFLAAPPTAVFSVFAQTDRFARWWGAGSTVEARLGGPLRICFPNGVQVSGSILELEAPTRLAFTYGYDAPGKPIPPGGSRVTVTLAARGEGTLLTLRHDLADEATRDAHVQGWRHQLGQLSRALWESLGPPANPLADQVLAACVEPDQGTRVKLLQPWLAADVTWRETWGALDGLEEVATHLGALQRFVPGLKPTRVGNAVNCHGSILVSAVSSTPPGPVQHHLTLVLRLGADALVHECTGVWVPA